MTCVAFTSATARTPGSSPSSSTASRVKSETSRFLNRRHLLRAHAFYEEYGGKTIILARFMPIIRTFAPFVAGIAKMSYARFALFNVTGGILWVASFVLGGYYFGTIPIVQRNFHIVIVAIVHLLVWWPAGSRSTIALIEVKPPAARPRRRNWWSLPGTLPRQSIHCPSIDASLAARE